jgi:hypothetical protein
VLAVNAGAFSLRGSPYDGLFGAREFLLFGNRHHDEHGALRAQSPRCGDDGCRFARRFHTGINRQIARPRVEAGQCIGAQADDRYALCLEHLERQRQIENGFRAGADNSNRGPSKLGEIRRHIVRCATMYTADATRRKHFDARFMRDDHRSRNCRCAIFDAPNRDWQIAAAAFPHRA